MVTVAVQQNVEAEQLKRAFCQVLVESAQPIQRLASRDVIRQIQLVIPHLIEVATALELWLEDEEIIKPSNRIALFYIEQAEYTEALSWLNLCLATSKKRLGEDHPAIATVLNNLAQVYDLKGQYSQAEPFLIQALQIRKKQLGNHHIDTATSLNNLATFYYSQRQYDESETFLLQSLKILRQELGENHPHVLYVLNNLAKVYEEHGRYHESEILHLNVVQRKRESNCSPLDIAISLKNLGELFFIQRRYSDAEPLFVQLLQLRESQLEARHPDIADALNNLGLLKTESSQLTLIPMMATTSQTQIIFPQSSSEQGYAFEYLLLRYFQQIRGSTIEHFSTYKHGKDKKWYQIDGLLVNDKRQLLEAKFYQKPVGCREIDPDERLQAAKAFNCDELLLISLNGFKDDVRSWASSVSLPVRFVEWNEIREDVLESFEGTFTVLLDQVLLEETIATSFSNPKSKLSFSNQLNATSIAGFPEFSVYSDSVELWLRRLHRLADWQEQLANGQFHYQDALETVRLLPNQDSHLSLEEAWRIEDAFSGYAARTYGAVKETAQALKNLGGSAVLKAVVQEIHLSFQQDRRLDKRTGDNGVRDSLNALAFMALVQRPMQRGGDYTLTPLGWAYVRSDEPDDQIFRERLTEWLPFRYFRLAIGEYQVPLEKKRIIEWFQTQYAPYEPYARCLFNANKVDGLMIWYKQLGF